MAGKLDWKYQNHARIPEYRAEYKGLILRAVHDSDASNPFEMQDGHWPMLVIASGHLTVYDSAAGAHISRPLSRFGDAALIHNQVHIAQALGSTVYDLINTHGDCDIEPVKYCRDAEMLREVLEQARDDVDYTRRELLDICAKLYEILDIPCLRHTSRGYCQGDEAELLIVATPEAVHEFYGADMTVEQVKLDLDLTQQAKLYDAWAWGDNYGYVVCRDLTERDEDGDPLEEEDLEELDSCWGYYGSDFVWSGLEEAAIENAEHHVKESVDALSQ